MSLSRDPAVKIRRPLRVSHLTLFVMQSHLFAMQTSVSLAAGNLGTWKSGNLEIWEFGDLGTWKSWNLETNKIKNKTTNLKIQIRSAQNVGKVWISRKKSSWPYLGPSEAIFSMERKNAKNAKSLPIFLSMDGVNSSEIPDWLILAIPAHNKMSQ